MFAPLHPKDLAARKKLRPLLEQSFVENGILLEHIVRAYPHLHTVQEFLAIRPIFLRNQTAAVAAKRGTYIEPPRIGRGDFCRALSTHKSGDNTTQRQKYKGKRKFVSHGSLLKVE